MKTNNDFTKILNKSHENKWVALSPDRKKVLAVSSDILKVKQKVGTNKKVLYMKVLPSNISFSFFQKNLFLKLI